MTALTMTRGFLIKADPTLVEPCARPDCGDIEGDHLICGCQGVHHGQPCGCPGFALPTPTCPHCDVEFPAPWLLDAHTLIRPADCRTAEARRTAEAERRRARDAHRAKAAN